MENMKLQKEIQSMEDLAHGEVKSLLRKYEKFRVSMDVYIQPAGLAQQPDDK